MSNQNDNQKEEQEPEPEYTPAGRALKAKFAKLRARQKERLAQRNMTDRSHHIEGQFGPESLPPFPDTDAKEGEKPVDPVREQALAIELANKKLDQPSEPSKNKSDSTLRLGRPSKPGHRSILSGLDLSVSSPGPFASDVFLHGPQFQITRYSNSGPPSNLLPVLGLCAPNASQQDSIHRNFQPYTLPRSNCGQSSLGLGFLEFPFHLAPGAGTSINTDIKSRESVADACSLSDSLSDVLQCRAKGSIPDYFPFNLCPLASTRGRCPDPVGISDSSFSAFQEKMALQSLAVNESHLPQFSHRAKNVPRYHPDFLPSLSLGTRNEVLNDSLQDLPAMPLLPNLRPPEEPKYNPLVREVPPTLGMGQVQSLYSSLPEKHKKVLDNIMTRTGSGSNNLFKKEIKDRCLV
ncbi:protein CHROMATIN REMODELING 4-like [Macadamia integrifolia]|uniref:protein CHROMATIN REMODELING 4-like n=1 Tax=Macadamia integrifolia TaxID=60698 RepID=UPI001C4E5BC3|nr:protein CHROMATIN REMODELING 4-like [Macadamia integrifolia]